ncbi:HAD family hydrolase [Paenibacillus koleovorans]|uniref:HAD family hydrolase n=1 Tax=Paenibacillus koleovorans TaxID=121608 RepID=UPI000FD9AA01|nr:HAD family hydrolase [Paenibacillus koleovorans]
MHLSRQPLRQTILFDLDDTLIHCNKYFDFVLDQYFDLMMTWFSAYRLTAQEVKDKQYEIDEQGVKRHGFTSDHFPQSLVDAYDHFSALTGRETSEEERARLYDLGRSVYLQTIEPYPNMTDTLERLANQGHDLFLYTGGDTVIQESKVKQMGLNAFFEDRIFISPHKTTPVMESILEKHRFDRNKTWMIGNSIRTDIVPAIETGINAIHIPAITEWKFNIVDIHVKPTRLYLQLKSLLEVPPTILQHGM